MPLVSLAGEEKKEKEKEEEGGEGREGEEREQGGFPLGCYDRCVHVHLYVVCVVHGGDEIGKAATRCTNN